MNKRRDLKILLNSNAPWSMSGYGVATRDLLRRWHKDGWPVACSAFFGLQGNPLEWEGIKCFPKIGDDWGGDAMVEHGRTWGANVVMSFQDIWVLNPHFLKQIKVWIPYVPIDKDPAPEGVIDKLRYAYKIITFSKFGQRELEKKGFASTMIHEGTDVNIFKAEDKVKARKDMTLPQDAFVFGMIAANKENPPRKGFQEAIEAFKMFSDKHPEAVIFFHIQQTSPQGFPIKHFLKHLGIEKKAYFVEGYQATHNSGSEVMRTEYSAFDVTLHPSQTEGFGLCIVESQACGTPTLVQRCQSMPELVIDGVTGGIAETATVGTQLTVLTFMLLT